MKSEGRECFRDSLAFATESCFASLANCLGFYENITSPIPKELEDYKLYDVEIRYGIVQVRLEDFFIEANSHRFARRFVMV